MKGSNSSDRVEPGEIFNLLVSPYVASLTIPFNYGEGVRVFAVDTGTEAVIANEFVSYLPTWGTL